MTKQINEEYVKGLLPARKVDAHKGDFGRVLLLCGSVGYTGAAALAARASARTSGVPTLQRCFLARVMAV